MRIPEHVEQGDKEKLVEALHLALKNDKTCSILLDQLSRKQKHEDESIDVIRNVMCGCIIGGAIIIVYMLGLKQGRNQGYNQGYWQGHDTGGTAMLERVLLLLTEIVILL